MILLRALYSSRNDRFSPRSFRMQQFLRRDGKLFRWQMNFSGKKLKRDSEKKSENPGKKGES